MTIASDRRTPPQESSLAQARTGSSPDQSQIKQLIERGDFLRRSPSRLGSSVPHKEWQHFLLHVPQRGKQPPLKLIVNFNLIDNVWAPPGEVRETARLIVLARSDRWSGVAERFRPERNGSSLDVQAGKIDLRFGANSLRWTGNEYRVVVDLEHRGIHIDLDFVPVTIPSPEMNRALAPGLRLSWFVVPRLLASGQVTIEGETWQVDDALAYHDHNWAVFRWGDDFTWEWASVLPDDPDNPWSIVLMRLTDRKRTSVRAQAALVWRNAQQVKRFRDHDINVTSDGLFRARDPFMVPEVMKLVNTGNTVDVPKSWRMHASSPGRDATPDHPQTDFRSEPRSGDVLDVVFHPADLSQVVMPSETDLEGVTVLNEATGPVLVTGKIDGHTINFEGQGVFEFLRS